MSQPVRAFLGLGSNMGDSRGLLAEAVGELYDRVAVSRLYETAPIGGPEQPPFLNLVVELATTSGPYELLERCRALERDADRVRVERWGPRTLDVDVLLYGDLRLEDPVLLLPHPRMWERRFVLQPLSDLAPELLPGGWGHALADQELSDAGRLSL
ncbi:MAG: 2-amino-4-hydroxy-6-hydroxymethyldihydropteridine diphosphokinase [Actinomycetota bacterium]|jgi:2-amino-4-hydroxy-6-hydroxymethyldihydropteridine diphosphokinase|nr:2-amino-4-hydroxy-6-hydroxymethyldihydropteridine diphosphokinase [Actinomycetota bacterium]